MNKIQQYRKASAEWMGVKEHKIIGGGTFIQYPNKVTDLGGWHPDQDHNQMAMMIDKLRENGCQISFYCHKDIYMCRITHDPSMENETELWGNETMLIIFMKAWSKYYKSLNG